MLRFSLSRRRFLASLSLVAAVAALLSAGCRSGGDGAGSGSGGSSSASAAGSPAPGVLRYPLTAEPTTLDPATVSDGPTIDMLQHLYEGLVGWNEKSEVVPLVAAEMPKISADGKTYTFTIRDGVKFGNGRQVTAEDVKYSLTRALLPNLNSPVATTYLNDIVGADAVSAGKATDLAGVKVVDQKTVQITLVGPRAYFLGKLTYPTGYVLAKEEVAKGPKTEQGAETIDAKNAATVGTGPFRLASYVRQNKAVLDANPDYWGGKPKLTRIERPIVLDTKTARNLYDAGELDYITLEKGDYENDRSNDALKNEIKTYDRAATYYLGMNQTNYAPFRDKRVRQAFAHAIDKDAIIQSVLLGVNQKAEGVVPKGIPGFDESFKGMSYDPEKAKSLLSAAGFPNGQGLPPLALTFREQQPDLRKTAEVVKEQLGAVGVQINLNEMEWGAFLKATDDKRVDFFHMRWAADYLDPQNFLSVLLHSGVPENRTGYSNKAYDVLLDEADASTDPAKRRELYRKAEAIVVDDAPWVPLYYQRDLELMKPYVSGVRDGLMGHLPHTTTTVQ